MRSNFMTGRVVLVAFVVLLALIAIASEYIGGHTTAPDLAVYPADPETLAAFKRGIEDQGHNCDTILSAELVKLPSSYRVLCATAGASEVTTYNIPSVSYIADVTPVLITPELPEDCQDHVCEKPAAAPVAPAAKKKAIPADEYLKHPVFCFGPAPFEDGTAAFCAHKARLLQQLIVDSGRNCPRIATIGDNIARPDDDSRIVVTCDGDMPPVVVFDGKRVVDLGYEKLEPKAVLGPHMTGGVLDMLLDKIINAGYSCDSVSAAEANVFSHGFEVNCNHFSYTYRVWDNGGQWVVDVK